MSGVGVGSRQTSAQPRHSFSREWHWGTWGLLLDPASTTLGTSRAPRSLPLTWALRPTTTVPLKLAPALCRLALAPPRAPLHGTRLTLGVTVSLQPLPANPGDEEPFLGGPRKSFWLKQHLLLLLHLLLSHLCPSSAYTTHILLGSRAALCTAGVLDKGHRHPALLPESCEVWGGGSIWPLPRLGWRG